MYFPLSFSDISLWLAATAIVLLISSESLYASQNFSTRVAIDKKLLRIAAVGCGLGFLVTVAMRVFNPF